jgi:hypothetical protein
MIKSNRIIDLSKFKGMKPQAAVGKYCLDLTDPVTGKVLERMSGNNHVFEDVLYANTTSSNTWINVTSGAWLVLNDSPLAVDPDMPYVMGQTVGYGRPSQAGLGLFRGAYNAANQKLAEWDLTSIRWKFQYDFTAPQAIGTIRQIGLTHQYNRALVRYQQSWIPISSHYDAIQYTSDERYSYGCSNGIVTKYDNYLGTQQQIDVSSIVGTSGTFAVAYAPATGKYYIVKSGVEMYEFTDSTFSTLSNTYSITSINFSASRVQQYVYGDYLYSVSSNYLYKADFVNNIAYVNVLNIADIQNNAAVLENNRAAYFDTRGTMGSDSYIMCFSAYRSGSNDFYKGFIFDMATDDVIGYMSNGDTYSHCVHPLTTSRIFCSTNGAMSAAITAKKLDADFVKPADRGMTATYELEVFW